MLCCIDNQYNECTAITTYKPKLAFHLTQHHTKTTPRKILTKNLIQNHPRMYP